MDKGTVMVKQTFVIFDLDETVICSSHRRVNNPDGSIDLAHWRENSTPEKVARDLLLPLAKAMRRIYEAGSHVIICTARPMQFPDFKFLADNNLPYHVCLHRHGLTDMRGDAQLKRELLTEYFASLGTTVAKAKPIMFDDNRKVITEMNRIGVICFDAIKENRRLAS
jgi:hypothetical protein